jgi:hypothetical protein
MLLSSCPRRRVGLRDSLRANKKGDRLVQSRRGEGGKAKGKEPQVGGRETERKRNGSNERKMIK